MSCRADQSAGDFFIDECTSTIEKIAISRSMLDGQLHALSHLLGRKHGVGVVFFVGEDFHFLRCVLHLNGTERCHFCDSGV